MSKNATDDKTPVLKKQHVNLKNKYAVYSYKQKKEKGNYSLNQ